MDEYESLSHSKWECKYHVVFISKCRRKVLYGNLRRHLGEVFRKLAEQKECRIEEGHLLADHVHMMISIPPKYSVSSVVGFIKARAQFTWRGCMGSRSRIMPGRASGHADISCPRLVGMRSQFGITSATRNRKTNGWIS
jgi:putative transposase